MISVSKLRLIEREISSLAGTLEIYERLYRSRQYAFWLDTSAPRDSHGWSFMGALEGPRGHILTVNGADPSLWEHLGERLGRYLVEGEIQSPFKGGYVGYLGYGLPTSSIAVAHPAERIPDLALLFCSRWLAIDHISGRVFACAACADDEYDEAESWMTSVARALQSMPAAVP